MSISGRGGGLRLRLVREIGYCFFNWVHIERFWLDSWASIWTAMDNARAFRVFLAFRVRLARITALVAVYICVSELVSLAVVGRL